MNQSANRVYLKFYDNMDYNQEKSETNNGVTDIKVRVVPRSKPYPYQKIEFFNKNLFTNRCKHKSNLFSVRIKDLDDLEDTYMSQLTNGNEISAKLTLKKEIQNAVYEITKNVCPVNTQFFKTYFG